MMFLIMVFSKQEMEVGIKLMGIGIGNLCLYE